MRVEFWQKLLYCGSPADKGDLEVGDEILEVNGKSLEDLSRPEVISHIHQCIRSRTICLRVKRRSANKLALDFAQSSHVQDAFVIAVEAQARERLERLSALKRIKPVDITKLCHQLSKENPEPELNGFLENSPIYVTSYPPPTGAGPVPCTTPPSKPSSAPGSVKKSPLSNGHAQSQVEDQPEEIELKQELKSSEDSTSTVTPSKEEKLASEFGGPGRRASSPFSNGRTEVLIGQDVPQSAGEKVKTTALVENKSVTATPPDCITRFHHYGNNPTITLNNGCEIPILGLGTWKSKSQDALRAVKYAIHVGYRHLDCAHVYQNQKEVGLAVNQKIEEGAICRENIFITSKLWNTFHGDYDRVKEGLEKTLADLCLSYVDLYLMHWPMGFVSSDVLFPMSPGGGIAFNTDCHFTHVWKEMEKLQKEGLTRMIGISNFNKGQIEKLLAVAEIAPAVNQVECHPYLNQIELSNFCRDKCINVTAYSPLGARDFVPRDTPGPMDDTVVSCIAKNHCRSPAQVLIRYQIQRGHLVIPKSVSNERIFQNFTVFDFNLSDDEMAALVGLEKGNHGRILRGGDYRNHSEYPFKELLGPASKDIPP